MSAALFGIVFLPESLARFGDLCAEAEERGFEWIGVADSQSVFRELYVALTVAALRTRRSHLGPLVTNPLTRHLVVTASAISSVDELSGGRVRLGLGSGDSAIYTIGAPPTTLAGLEDSILTLRRLTAGESVAREWQAGPWTTSTCGGSPKRAWPITATRPSSPSRWLWRPAPTTPSASPSRARVCRSTCTSGSARSSGSTTPITTSCRARPTRACPTVGA